MAEKRVPLYDRLPEIYRIKDEEQSPRYQLENYLALVEEVFGAIHENIESLYHDLFIETCDDWVIPYIGDLLGVSHLSGDPWTLRADVVDTIALRRRKGTLGAIELLVYNLTQWGVHCVELRENLVWSQHLNHQRPDEGGEPPYSLPSVTMYTVIRGGTATLRDPAMLSLLNTPFDPFAHIPDLKPPAFGCIRYNLPNLAIFLWRLETYQVSVSKPFSQGVYENTSASGDEANFVAQFDVHPLGEPVRLFNTHQFDPDRRPPVVTQVDETPGPVLTARLTEGSEAGAPGKYVVVETYDETDHTLESLDVSDEGLQLHLPGSVFADDEVWSFRGSSLYAWESSVQPPINNREVVIDPVIGRIAIGVNTAAEGEALREYLLLTYTYGAVGPVGAHPISRSSSPSEWKGETVMMRTVNYHESSGGLQDALNDIQDSGSPIVIEIQDSMVHELDIDAVSGNNTDDAEVSLQLNRSLIIRAADGHRPIIRLARPLRFRPTNVRGADDDEQADFDAVMSNLTVRLEGLYLTRGDSFPAGESLIARAALNSIEIINCTLDPGGYRELDGARAPIHTSITLMEPYGFSDSDEEEAFNQTPEVIVQRSITGPLFIDPGYRLFIQDSIIDAGSGVNDDPATASFAVSGASNVASDSWGPETQVNGITVFGRMRVESINGRGGIWVHTLEVLYNQKGCIKYSYFSGYGDRLPQNHACVKGTDAQLRFTSEIFGHYAYGQIAHATDFEIRERGPGDDAMGAFGFLLQAHKWRNLGIRFREFMPVGVRPLLIPVT